MLSGLALLLVPYHRLASGPLLSYPQPCVPVQGCPRGNLTDPSHAGPSWGVRWLSYWGCPLGVLRLPLHAPEAPRCTTGYQDLSSHEAEQLPPRGVFREGPSHVQCVF